MGPRSKGFTWPADTQRPAPELGGAESASACETPALRRPAIAAACNGAILADGVDTLIEWQQVERLDVDRHQRVSHLSPRAARSTRRTALTAL